MTKRIGIIYFSPTNTTKNICAAVALGMGAKDLQVIDMTLPKTRIEITANINTVTEKIDCLIVGSPVHSGKLPLLVLEYLRTMNGKGKEAIAIVVYGNRDYGIALYNMVELLSGSGFSVNAAGAFIGQHSYSDIVPVALGRPDELDMEKARQFGVRSLNASRCLSLNDVPIQIDKISKSEDYTSLKPAHNEKQCIQCGKCAKECPVGLLSSDTGRYLNRDAKRQCIDCMACVQNCTQKAKVAKVNLIVKMIMKRIFRKALRERKEPLTIVV